MYYKLFIIIPMLASIQTPQIGPSHNSRIPPKSSIPSRIPLPQPQLSQSQDEPQHTFPQFPSPNRIPNTQGRSHFPVNANANSHPHQTTHQPYPSILPPIQPSSGLRHETSKLIQTYLLHNLTDQQSMTLRSGIVSIQYMTDSTYIGQVSNSQDSNHNTNNNDNNNYIKQGKGVYKYSNNDIYMGDWKQDQFNGLGLYIFGNTGQGDMFKGLFLDGNCVKGIMYYGNGDIYEGEIKGGLRDGHGVMKYAHNNNNNNRDNFVNEYSGYWKNNLKQGQGQLKSTRYIINGAWEDDMLNGQVKIVLNTDVNNNKGSESEEGIEQFVGFVCGNQLIKGRVIARYGRNQRYEGEVYQGKFEGYGRYVQQIKAPVPKIYQYQGYFIQGKPSPGKQFTITLIQPNQSPSTSLPNAASFSTSFISSSQIRTLTGELNPTSLNLNGPCIITFTNGDHYEGQFQQNHKSGHGVYKFGNGDVYEGEFKNDAIHGKGWYRWKDRSVGFKGQFESGKLIQSKGQFINLSTNSSSTPLVSNSHSPNHTNTNQYQNNHQQITLAPPSHVKPTSLTNTLFNGNILPNNYVNNVQFTNSPINKNNNSIQTSNSSFNYNNNYNKNNNSSNHNNYNRQTITKSILNQQTQPGLKNSIRNINYRNY